MVYIIPLGTTRKAGKIPYTVLSLVVLNILFFLGTWYGHDVKTTFCSWGVVPQNLSIITLITSAFLHAGWLHLIGNMLFLLVFGPPVEDRVGSPMFAGLYAIFAICSGLVFAAVQLLFLSEEFHALPCVGASGAIAGVMGYFLYACWGQQVIVGYWILFIGRGTAYLSCLETFIVFCLTDFIMGYATVSDGLVSGMAHWGHIGGLVAGLTMGLFLYDESVEEDRQLSEMDPNSWCAIEKVKSQEEVWTIRTFLAPHGVTCRAVLLPEAPCSYQVLVKPSNLKRVKSLIAGEEIPGGEKPNAVPLPADPHKACPICGEQLSGRPVARCFACQATAHTECAQFAGGCQIPDCTGNRKGTVIEGVVQTDKPHEPRAEVDVQKTAMGAARILGHLGLSMSKTCFIMSLLVFAVVFLLFYIFIITGGGRAIH